MNEDSGVIGGGWCWVERSSEGLSCVLRVFEPYQSAEGLIASRRSGSFDFHFVELQETKRTTIQRPKAKNQQPTRHG